MFEKFDIEDKNIFKVCVVATMSSGKSTFINSIIGEEIMPEKNEACTARTMAVLDNDSAIVKKAHIIRTNGTKEILEINNREILDRINNDEDVKDFLVETDIKSIKNTSRALMIFDTPGVNNSGDERHGKCTEQFLQQMDMGVIIYLLNATQLATNDDSLLLQYVSDHVKKQEGKVKIFFVINKIDALDLETESISGTINIAKEYIENHGIKNPIIYPFSALAAKVLRMALYRKEMTRRERRKLEDIYENYRTTDNFMLEYALLGNLENEVYEIGDEEVSKARLQRAIENTGIIAIEKRVEEYLLELENSYAPEVVIKAQFSESLAQELQEHTKNFFVQPFNGQWNAFEECNQKIKESKEVQSLNLSVQSMEDISAEFEILLEELTIPTDVKEFISNIEKVKKNLYDTFSTGMYAPVKRNSGLFFYPENDEKECIRVKELYLMSVDGLHWKAIRFSNIIELVENKVEFYLFNEETKFLFKVNEDNGTNVVGICDMRLPLATVKINGLNVQDTYVINVEEYIQKLAAEEAKKKYAAEEAEELLKRSYKGILFDSQKAKDDAIQQEEEIAQYCLSLNGKACAELWAKKTQISRLPSEIFSKYLSKIIVALEVQENIERAQYMEKIQAADIDSVRKIDAEVNRPYYSQRTVQMLHDAINQRLEYCQKVILNDLILGFENSNREELKELIEKINAKNFDSYMIADYIAKINKQYDLVEEKELRSICEGIEEKKIVELIAMENLIRSREYQDKFTSKYYHMIQSRIEFLHVKNLETYCEGLFSKDRESLNDVRRKVEHESCKNELKKQFYDLINQREEELDYQDLCIMTENIANQSLEELSELYTKLDSGLYNEKFIKAFLVTTRTALEQAQLNNVEQMLSDLRNMNKEQVLDISRQIEKCGYADRVVSLAREKIVERCYVLDMFELMALGNDFDRLSLSEVRSLKNSLNHKNVCERSKATYVKKLLERERAISKGSVSQLANYIQRQVMELGLGTEGIKIPTVEKDFDLYVEMLSKVLGASELREAENIPILIIPQFASLAMNKKYLYYESKSKCTKIDLNEIRAFSTEKKLLSEHLMLTLRNGTVLTVSGTFNKKLLKQLATLLTEVVQNCNNSTLLSSYTSCKISVSPLQPIDFELRSLPHKVTEEYITSLFIKKLDKVQLQGSSVKWITNEKWMNTESKFREEFGIKSDLKLIWCYDRTLFNTAKEGIAIGSEGVYIKNNNQPLALIRYDDIYQVKMEGNQLVVGTVKNERYFAEFGAKSAYEIVNLIDEYIKGIQFIRFDKKQ